MNAVRQQKKGLAPPSHPRSRSRSFANPSPNLNHGQDTRANRTRHTTFANPPSHLSHTLGVHVADRSHPSCSFRNSDISKVNCRRPFVKVNVNVNVGPSVTYFRPQTYTSSHTKALFVHPCHACPILALECSYYGFCCCLWAVLHMTAASGPSPPALSPGSPSPRRLRSLPSSRAR